MAQRQRPKPPHELRAWLLVRTVLLAGFGGAHWWGWFALVALWMAGDYAMWWWSTRETR